MVVLKLSSGEMPQSAQSKNIFFPPTLLPSTPPNTWRTQRDEAWKKYAGLM
jgi:hypothetical protein